MSVEIYVHGFSQGEPAGLPVAEILDILKPTGALDEFGFYPLHYDSENNCDFTFSEDSGTAVAITVFRPCFELKLYDALFKVLASGPYVTFAPGSPPVAADSKVASELPVEMIGNLGTVVEVGSGAELRDALFAA